MKCLKWNINWSCNKIRNLLSKGKKSRIHTSGRSKKIAFLSINEVMKNITMFLIECEIDKYRTFLVLCH